MAMTATFSLYTYILIYKIHNNYIPVLEDPHNIYT